MKLWSETNTNNAALSCECVQFNSDRIKIQKIKCILLNEPKRNDSTVRGNASVFDREPIWRSSLLILFTIVIFVEYESRFVLHTYYYMFDLFWEWCIRKFRSCPEKLDRECYTFFALNTFKEPEIIPNSFGMSCKRNTTLYTFLRCIETLAVSRSLCVVLLHILFCSALFFFFFVYAFFFSDIFCCFIFN